MINMSVSFIAELSPVYCCLACTFRGRPSVKKHPVEKCDNHFNQKFAGTSNSNWMASRYPTGRTPRPDVLNNVWLNKDSNLIYSR